jgi:hypothetical protein
MILCFPLPCSLAILQSLVLLKNVHAQHANDFNRSCSSELREGYGGFFSRILTDATLIYCLLMSSN